MADVDYAYRRLVNTLGPERVARNEYDRMAYSHDFASLPKIALLQWQLYPDFVVLPQTTEEVAALVKLSDESGLPIVPRGGGTGWYGGAVPNRGGVLVDMHKMNRVVALDPALRTVTVEAGSTWHDLARYVESKGFVLPFEPTNAVASTIGGAINSGLVGFGTYANGALRDAIVNLEVVLPDGRILKTAAGADASGAFANVTPLFLGAEGTLGILTKVTLRLRPKPEVTKAVSYGFSGTAQAARFLQGIVDSGVTPYHALLLDKDHFVMERVLRPETPDPADLALVALQGPKDDVADQEKTIDESAAKAGGRKLAPEVSARLWARRFTMYSARRLSKGLVVSNNLVPVAKLEEAVTQARTLIRKMKLNGSVQAFLVDSSTASLAPYVLMDDTTPSGGTALGFVKKMGDASLELGGHPMGLGLLMVFNLRKMHGRSAPFLAEVKNVLDPSRKLNGGKTVEVWTKFHFPGIRAVPPPAMAAGLNLMAFLRRIKPTQDKFVKAYEHERGS
ncbi:MAG TPA: FAD-binding oxidoreductase [Thermoplasmata archaeon]|nr:FAD-binding oxidoreductase [Thermoplasmata archaeon]